MCTVNLCLTNIKHQVSQKQNSNTLFGVFVLPLSRETVDAGATYENTVSITPQLSENKEKRGLSLDGRLKDEDTNLASTTM